MSDLLKKLEREGKLERIRGKKRRRKAPKPAPPSTVIEPAPNTREFGDSPSAHKYARAFGGRVEAITPPGEPVYYVVHLPKR